MKFFLLLMLLQIPLTSAQTVPEGPPLESQEETFPLDEHSLSELSQEAERQEDILHPVGEVNDWSLGSEDLPSEEFQ